MKMRKLLAAGVAASLAVTSMATVASAAEKTFQMATSEGVITYTTSAKPGLELGDKYYLTDEEFNADPKEKTLGISALDTIIVKLPNSQNGYTQATGVTLMVTGVKGTRGAASKTYSYAFQNIKDYTVYEDGDVYDYSDDAFYGSLRWDNDAGANVADGKVVGINGKGEGDLYILPVYSGTAPADGFLPEQFLEITKIEVTYTGFESYVTGDKNEYAAAVKAGGDWINSIGAPVKGFDFADGGADDSALLTEIQNFLSDFGGAWGLWAGINESKINNLYPFIAAYASTWGTESESDSHFLTQSCLNSVHYLYRDDIQLLSYSDAYKAYTNSMGAAGTNAGNREDLSQTYNPDTGLGTNPEEFAGLASQVADFFNKKTNGTITFQFNLGGDNAAMEWLDGGVPSTQVGLANVLDGAADNDFALFVNYHSTGTLVANTAVDAAAGTVTFTIDKILEDLGYQTNGVIETLFFGLTKGACYDFNGNQVYGEAGEVGLLVESITLATEEDADVEADIEEEDDADVEIEDDVEVEEDDDVEIEDDVEVEEDDDVEIEDDTTEEDDADAAGDVIVETEDDDANPGTGVALAVVPALVAAAAVVVSKKRS